MKLISFYLPQYHPVPENDAWWGKGFTEWRFVARAEPQFPGHYQPHHPADLGFYDLRVPETREAQVDLARQFGIDAFCYYYYWFDGRRILERPLNDMLNSGKPDFPFCICWANENWTRSWDGKSSDVLLEQKHTPESDIRFIEDVLPVLSDERYLKINGRPLLLVYRVELLPEPAETAKRWRAYCVSRGLPEPYLCLVQSFKETDPRTVGFDAAVLFPPNLLPYEPHLLAIDTPLEKKLEPFSGAIVDYRSYSKAFQNLPVPDYTRFECVMPSWDNTARRGSRAIIFANSSPELFEQWVRQAVARTGERLSGDEQLVFVNAWNEWAEGCHLEPDLRYGTENLQAIKNAISFSRDTILEARRRAAASQDPLLVEAVERLIEHAERRERSLIAFTKRAENLPSPLCTAQEKKEKLSAVVLQSPSQVQDEVRTGLLAHLPWFGRSYRPKVAIFGASVTGEAALKAHRRRISVKAFVDNDSRKHGTLVCGIPVVSPQDLRDLKVEKVVIASAHVSTIYEQLLDMGFSREQILLFSNK